MSYNKIIKEENASYNANTLGDLIRNFNIELNEYLLELLDKFPTDDKYGITYDNHYIIELENNKVYAFNGSAADVPESPDYNIMLDLMHSRVYYIGQSNVGNSIHEYDIMGNLLAEKDYGLKEIDVDEFIRTHFIDYHCKTINDLLINFNLDLQLSDKLKQHRIDEDFDFTFNEYFIQEHENNKYYVFPASFYMMMVDDVDSPIYYIDSDNQLLYEQTGGMLGITVTVYDANDIEIKTIDPENYYHGEFDIGKIIDSDK